MGSDMTANTLIEVINDLVLLRNIGLLTSKDVWYGIAWLFERYEITPYEQLDILA